MCDFSFKTMIVGDVGVGKSSLFLRFLDDLFIPKHYPTVRTQFESYQLEVDGKQVLLRILDAAVEERCRSMLEIDYLACDGVIIVYDSTSAESFRNVDSWVKQVGIFCSQGVNVMLVGTKSDQMQKREVTAEEASRYAEQHGLSFVEASAKDDINVQEIFLNMASEIYKRRILEIETKPLTQKEDTGDGTSSKKKDTGDHQGAQIEKDKDKGLEDGITNSFLPS